MVSLRDNEIIYINHKIISIHIYDDSIPDIPYTDDLVQKMQTESIA